MPAYARQKAGGEFTPVPIGAHVGVCTSVVDLGLQPGGQYEPAYKLLVSWTLPDQHTDAGKPMIISGTYTSSMNKKANLRKLIENWFGKSFPTEDAASKFDFKALLGRSCLVNVIHKESQGKTFANVSSVTALPGAIPKPATPDVLTYYWPEDDSQTAQQISAAYAQLPEWVKKKLENKLPDDEDEGAEPEAASTTADDDIPF